MIVVAAVLPDAVVAAVAVAVAVAATQGKRGPKTQSARAKRKFTHTVEMALPTDAAAWGWAFGWAAQCPAQCPSVRKHTHRQQYITTKPLDCIIHVVNIMKHS